MIVSDMKKELRTGKVFVDWSQNDEHKTTVSVYSLRARELPTVSTPVTWDEVERALKKKDVSMLVFEAAQVLDRVKKMGDLHEPVLRLKQKLPDVMSMMGKGATKVDLAAAAEEPARPRASSTKAKKKTARETGSAKAKPAAKKGREL
jgi:bifunctional non-homologous end joining protein LigD